MELLEIIILIQSIIGWGLIGWFCQKARDDKIDRNLVEKYWVKEIQGLRGAIDDLTGLMYEEEGGPARLKAALERKGETESLCSKIERFVGAQQDIDRRRLEAARLRGVDTSVIP